MKNIFNLNNPVWVFIGRLVDVFVLNILWFICSLPLVTFGPATISLYYSMMKTVCDENPKYVRNFFKTMKENMANGIPLGLIMLIAGALITYSIFFYSANANYSANMWIMILKWAMFGLAFLYVLAFQYVFALSARFVNTTLQTIKNGLFLALQHFWWTLVMVVVTLLPGIILYLTNFLPILLLGFGLSVYINAYILNKILDPLIRKAREEQGLLTPEEEEENRYTAEELAAASQWHMPASLASSGYGAVEEEAEEAAESADQAVEDVNETVGDAAAGTADTVNKAAEVVDQTAESAVEAAGEAAESVVEAADQAAENVLETAGEIAEDAAETASKTVEEAADTLSDTVENGSDNS